MLGRQRRSVGVTLLIAACAVGLTTSPCRADEPPTPPASETAASRALRLRVRPYAGGAVPADMHVEDRYAESQRIPIYVGVPLLVFSYLEATLFALAAAERTDALALSPVVGSFVRADDSFERIGCNHGPHALTSGVLDALLGVSSISNGTVQAVGLGLTVFGVARIAKGRQPHLVPNTNVARVTLHPLFVMGDASLTGLSLTVSGF